MFTDFFDFSQTTIIENSQFLNSANNFLHFAVKRDDLIDPQISGNKWRKLKYNFKSLAHSPYTSIASFGGAFSNHIAALAGAGARAGVPTLGFIRTHEIDLNNPTLQLAHDKGMKLVALTREEYRQRKNPDFIASLQKQYPDHYFVPEGGSNESASLGLKELADEIKQQSNIKTIASAIGSGGTISGLLDHLPEHEFIGVAVVEDTPLLNELEQKYGDRLTIVRSAMFGGYGKTSDELNEFCWNFTKQTQIPIEPVYTGKLFYALCEQELALDKEVLAIHTGGLQGLKGLDYRRQCPPRLWQQVASLLDV